MVMACDYKELRRLEDEAFDNLDPEVLKQENEQSNSELKGISKPVSKFSEVINALPTIKDSESPFYGYLEQKFWRYYLPPWDKNYFFDPRDPFNDLIIIIYGPRGGGKSGTGSSLSIIDGQMRGIPVVSNLPISWAAKDNQNKLYKVESIPFDAERFVRGDPSLKYKRVLLDEGNYLADRLRSTSNKNLAITDVLQQARKFRMPVIFCTINYMWIDPRITGSLCDVLIECKDLYYTSYGKKHGLKKGERIAWDMTDQSGKITNHQGMKLPSMTFDLHTMHHCWDTENWVDPHEARKKLKKDEKTIIDENGNEISVSQWYKNIDQRLAQIPDGEYSPREWWDMIGITDDSLKLQAGKYLSRLGIQKTGYARSNYHKELDLA